MAYENVQTRQLPFAARYIADVLMFRHLCWNLVASDLRARFRRSSIGILWAVIQPFSFALMIAAVWGSMMGSKDYWGYSLYVFSGLLIWDYFSTIVTVSQDALVNAEGYLKQTRIPFIAFQVRTPLTSMVITLCGVSGLLILMIALDKLPAIGPQSLLLPVFFVLLLSLGIPLSILMSILGTLFRDVKHISQIAIQALFFISPVMLDRHVFDRPELQFLIYANPVVPLLDLFRSSVLQGELWHASSLYALLIWIAAFWALALLVSAKVGRRIIFAL